MPSPRYIANDPTLLAAREAQRAQDEEADMRARGVCVSAAERGGGCCACVSIFNRVGGTRPCELRSNPAPSLMKTRVYILPMGLLA